MIHYIILKDNQYVNPVINLHSTENSVAYNINYTRDCCSQAVTVYSNAATTKTTGGTYHHDIYSLSSLIIIANDFLISYLIIVIKKL